MEGLPSERTVMMAQPAAQMATNTPITAYAGQLRLLPVGIVVMGNLHAGRGCSQEESSRAGRPPPKRGPSWRRTGPYADREPELSETSTCREPLRLMAVHAHPDDE